MKSLPSTLVVLFLGSLVGCGPSADIKSPSAYCGKSVLGGYDFNWCVENNQSKNVIYYFHGMNGSEHSWKQSQLSEVPLSKLPNVITISFGPRWFLSDVEGLGRPSKLTVFERNIMPSLEAKLGSTQTKRYLAGESMGGYNALRLARSKPEHYEKVAAFCPAILTIQPYSNPIDIAAFFMRNPFAHADILFALSAFGLKEYPLPGQWERNDPLFSVKLKSYSMPPVFLTANTEDAFGFYEGTVQYAKALNKRGMLEKFVDQGGQHCQHSREALTAFTNSFN